ncbi:pollen receptor-like kinase 1 [Heracleum sosnowskyi]|uniref:non-specific serine/threonine protein kinase n=1 Tax=Heracleum sosnowskyi TaxID=360622 RepID=A0AAD8IUC8_9APIA|nr:pollen receptor-like kinase 1 [Heracleum sosnowskyi]
MALVNHNIATCLLPRALVLLSVILNLSFTSFSAPESEILIKFKDSLTDNSALNSWDPSKPPCPGQAWAGIICQDDKVWGLKLQNMGLKGKFDINLLKDLPLLRTISINGNQFEGSFPNIRTIIALKSFYMAGNNFSGAIRPDAFEKMTGLKKFDGSRNKLTGSIPSSLTTLPLLTELRLEHNAFTGQIPNFLQDRLTVFNVSENQLDGPIPDKLTRLDATAFMGNVELCGGPMPPCPSPTEISAGTVILCVLLAAAALAAIFVAIVILRPRKENENPVPEKQHVAVATQVHNNGPSLDMDKVEKGMPPAESSPPAANNNNNNQVNVSLTFLKEETEKFDLTDLMKASAEILGSGMLGSTFKAALGRSGQVMVVKRFRQMNNAGKEEFQEHMRRLGRLKHKNLLPLVAFYYRKEEKLLVTEYIDNANLSAYLHGNRGRGVPSLDWPKRLKIVKGIAKGLQYLYNELPSIVAPHGHLKSANILLNDSWEPLLTDYALSPIVNQDQAHEIMIAYRSPEYNQQGRITKKTDVWSLGMVILEVLTGRYPSSTSLKDRGNEPDLAAWLQSIDRQDWKTEALDKNMMGKTNRQDQMLKLLEIGLSCCEPDVEKRWEIKEAVERIEKIKE